MSEPFTMTFDFGPYIRMLQRRPDPKKMTDEQLAQKLKQVRRLPDNSRPYAGTCVMTGLFACVATAMTAAALGAAAPGLWMIGVGFALWQGMKHGLPRVAQRTYADMALLETEIKNREIDRAAKTAQEKLEAEAKKAAHAALIARRAQEAFDKAIGSGLPLERKISVSKSIKLKARAEAGPSSTSGAG